MIPAVIPVPSTWRAATRADRLARLCAALQRPDLASAQLRRASELLAEAAASMDAVHKAMTLAALREVRAGVDSLKTEPR